MIHGRLNKDAAVFSALFACAELCAVILGFSLSHIILFGHLVFGAETILAIGVFSVLFYACYNIAGLYKPWRGVRPWAEFKLLCVWWLVIVSGTGLFLFVTKFGEIVSRLWFGWGVVAAFCLCIVLRFTTRQILKTFRRNGYNFRSVAVLGNLDDVERIKLTLTENAWAGFRIVKHFQLQSHSEPLQSVEASVKDIVIDDLIEELYAYIEEMRQSGHPLNQVWICLPLSEEKRIAGVIKALDDTPVDVKYVPSLLGLKLLSGSFDVVADIGLVNISDFDRDKFSHIEKAVFDIVVSSVAVVVLSPLLLLIALLVKLDSKGPVFFRQKRYGVDGKEIIIYKFRSMATSPDSNTVIQATRGDTRVTRVGRFLRSTSLDEIPQFFNVLKGDMSVVGPRPHAVSHNEEYRHKISGYMKRHRIKPGMTGWAQINGWRGETDTLVKMEKRVEYDIDYIHRWSLWFDFKILLLTVYKGFSHKNAY